MYLGAFVFLIGLCVGSFLNVVIFRTRNERSIVRGRSRCTVCQIELKPTELVPVFSFLFLRGRCRMCASKISLQYPLVEFVTGSLFLLFFLRYTQGFALQDYINSTNIGIAFLRDIVFVAFLVIVFVYDLRYVEILDRFTVPAMGFALVMNLLLGVDAKSMLLGAAVLGGFFLIQYTVSKGRWVGGGDIRMGLLMGLMLGLRDGLMALFVAYMIGAAFGLLLIVSKRANWKTAIPFGTFLSIATLIVLLFGKPMLYWYLGLFL